ncbi:hypothetical protein MUY27_17495 [Mucilaginibacter sp. RS28]|uniref:Outer membrane protein beta-barrel domain-containing protein n=1 Tax=Mucilaginibacter straminoryzae TaxID=2932774 RepID=A0A9X2BEL0_9SPHI|nr:hypothetical protein [Mucilaginibacter straminoryzae]MCJ8211518.1 hypothetical protein [Mucilaginibacter straminoryzae]
MKKATKLAAAAFAFAGLLFTSNVTKAQTTGHDSQAWRFGVGVEPGIPTGDMRNFSHFALGGNVRLQKDLSGSVSLMGTVGYTNFFARDYGIANYDPKDYGIVPLKAGVKAYVAPHLYFSGEAGAGFETSGSDKSTKLILSPGIGYSMSGSGLDVGLRYDNFSGGNSINYGQVALRIAYGFRL